MEGLKDILNDLYARYRKYLFWFIIPIFILYIVFFYPNAKESLFNIYIIEKIFKPNVSLCDETVNNQLLKDGNPIISLNHYWIETTPIFQTNGTLAKIRYDQLSIGLKKMDSIFSSNNDRPYSTELLLPLFKESNSIDSSIINYIRAKNLLYLQENVEDSKGCNYDLRLNLAKKSYQSVKDIITLKKNIGCIDGVIHEIIINPLNEKKIITIILGDIFKALCDKCNDLEDIKRMRSECINDDCSGIYFERSHYKLTSISETIFERICKNLSEKESLTIEFYGYTDPMPVTNTIKYDGYAVFPKVKEKLLSGEANTNPETEINDNLELSYARAYSCLNFVQKIFKNKKNINLKYTGMEVDESSASESRKRTVKIIIRKN